MRPVCVLGSFLHIRVFVLQFYLDRLRLFEHFAGGLAAGHLHMPFFMRFGCGQTFFQCLARLIFLPYFFVEIKPADLRQRFKHGNAKADMNITADRPANHESHNDMKNPVSCRFCKKHVFSFL